MKKTTVALVIATVMAAAASPALAHCGGSHGKSYRAAPVAKKPAPVKATTPGAAKATTTPSKDLGPATTSEPSFMPGQAQVNGFGSQA